MPLIHVVDFFHDDDPIDLHAMKDAGAVGVIIKAGQGSVSIDPRFYDYRARAITVFDPGCVHSYLFADGSNPATQVQNFLKVTQGMPGRWIDYERNPSGPTCSLQQALMIVHILQIKQGRYPGIYGSDEDLLGAALDAGHFAGACPLWLARYRQEPPDHDCDLWQFAEGEPGEPTIGGKGYDVSQFMKGDAQACAEWMKSIAAACVL